MCDVDHSDFLLALLTAPPQGSTDDASTFGFGRFLHSIAHAFAADAGVFGAAVQQGGGTEGGGMVGDHPANPKSLISAEEGLEVRREHAGLQSIGDVVDGADRLIEGIVRLHGDDGWRTRCPTV